MIVNLAKSLQEVDYLIRAVGYVIGILFMIKAVSKFKKIGDARARSSSSEKMFVPVVYTLMSMILIYSPTAINILSNTTFGANNILQYSDYSSVDTVTAVKFLVQVIGTIWFIRGCVLLAQASEPGVQHGPKGFVFLLALWATQLN